MTIDPNVRILVATPADATALREIGVETYLEHFSSIWSPAGLCAFMERDFSESALRNSLAAPESHGWWLLKDTDDAVFGYAKVNWRRPDPARGEIGAELQKIYFRASGTGKGYGGRLMDVVIEAARARGESSLWLCVLNSNAAARRFYAARGFETIGEMSFATDIAEIGMVSMRLRLGR